jgi:hypothetical protein
VSTSIPADPAQKFAEYADGTRLVSTDWVAEHAGDPGLVIVESDEDVLLYETGHIPGAVKVDWHTELNDPVTRDYVDGEGFAALMSAKGISVRTPSSSTATSRTGGPPTPCGSSPSSVTKTSASWTAAARNGRPKAAR